MLWSFNMELHNLLISEGTLLSESDKSTLPSLFNDPFSYSPHPLVVEVSHKVFKHLLESDFPFRQQVFLFS